MRRLIAALAVAALAAALLAASAPDQLADAGSRKKVHFTQTVPSSQDPGRPGGQMALLLAPSDGALYDGSVTYAASAPARLAVLHEIAARDAGPGSWTADGKRHYAVSLFGAAESGSLEFTGAALALVSGEEFTATASVDAWTRGQPAAAPAQEIAAGDGPQYPVARAAVPATIPLHRGIHEGGEVLYIVTDGSDAGSAGELSEAPGWRVELSEALAGAPEEALQRLYVFKNGVEGGGLYGFQDDLFSAAPGSPGYGALAEVVEVTWRPGQRESVLGSEADAVAAEEGGRVSFEETGVVLNAPQVAWPGGQLEVRADGNVTDSTPYDGGQVVGIDRGAMSVTFVAHRAWGPDGRTVYQIVTDATPLWAAEAMGVPESPASAALAGNATADLIQFRNGIRGPGQLGFQPGVAAASPGGDGYTPMRGVHVAEWADPASARLLETLGDVEAFRGGGDLSVGAARPANSDHVVNSPSVDPFQ